MYGIGIDIGSTATKIAVIDRNGVIVHLDAQPTGYSSVETARNVKARLESLGFLADDAQSLIVATGYGRISVPYANKTVTEITCHGRGATHLFGGDGTVIDVGGQDTKVIHLVGGAVKKFTMNDKCSAGTGRFLEIMANRLGVSQEELASLARKGSPTPISSMCTVFAESEVISLVGQGEPRENIANGIIDSVMSRVATLALSMPGQPYFLTGGLCENDYAIQTLSDKLGAPIDTCPQARYAGAIGAALIALDNATA